MAGLEKQVAGFHLILSKVYSLGSVVLMRFECGGLTDSLKLAEHNC